MFGEQTLCIESWARHKYTVPTSPADFDLCRCALTAACIDQLHTTSLSQSCQSYFVWRQAVIEALAKTRYWPTTQDTKDRPKLRIVVIIARIYSPTKVSTLILQVCTLASSIKPCPGWLPNRASLV